MRTPTKKQPDKPVTYLWERHKEVARRILCGQRPVDICKDLGYTQSWMSILTNSPVFQNYLAKLRERTEASVVDVRERIKEGSEAGVEYLLNVLKDDTQTQVTPSLKVKIAQDFLDRAGHGRTTKIEETKSITIINEDRIEALKKRRAEVLSRLSVSDAIVLPLDSIEERQPEVRTLPVP